MNILYLTQKFPYPLTDGGNIRSFYMLKALTQQHNVTLLSGIADPRIARNCGELSLLCKQMNIFPVIPSKAKTLYSLGRGWVGRQPYFMYNNYSANVKAAVQREMDRRKANGSNYYQAVHFNHIDVTRYLDCVPDGVAAVLDTHNAMSVMFQRLAQAERQLSKRWYLKRQEKNARRLEAETLPRMGVCLACSAEDARQLQSLAPEARIEVIPNGVDTRLKVLPENTEAANPPELVFVGALDYLPNGQGIIDFCRDVFPLIKQQIPEIRLNIIGRNPGPELKALVEGRKINLLGEIIDVRQHLKPQQIMVVPLKLGGGTRLKILEAMSLGLPIVSTTLGAEGLELEPEKHLLIGDDPQTMSRQIIRLYNDPPLRTSLAEASRKLAVEKYDWQIIGRKLLEVYKQLISDTSSG